MSMKEKIKAGQKVYGTMIRMVRNPNLAVLAKKAGLDFILYDGEHCEFGLETLKDAFAVANAMDFAALARVPVTTKDYVSRYLDLGACGIMAPMTETAQNAADLAKWSKFAPIGERGFGLGLDNVSHMNAPHATMMEKANERVVSIAQIETKMAIENADIIAATEGVDALLIGPNDLSISLGIPGDLLNPIEIEAIAHVGAACKRNGKAFGVHAGPALLGKFIKDLDIVMMDTDIDMIYQGLSNVCETCKNL